MRRYHRRVIRLKAEDSPNVRLAHQQMANGFEPTGEVLVPGVVDWETYQHRRLTWDKIKQCIGLDGEFYEGAELMMFPPQWLSIAEKLAESLTYPRPGTAMGVDTAEGGDKTCWAIIDSQGLIELQSVSTPDTNVIPGRTLGLMREYGVQAERVMFDQGGGGHEHVDRIRAMGHRVRMVSFGESATPEPTYYTQPWEQKVDERRERLSYKNRRAEMYWQLRTMLQPTDDSPGFAIPARFSELRRQLAPIPVRYTEEGKILLLPKHKRDSKDTRETLDELIGCSPDEADSLALAVHSLVTDVVTEIGMEHFW